MLFHLLIHLGRGARAIAGLEAGLSICDYNKRIADDPTEDRKIDDRTREVAIARRDENMVFD